MTEPNKYKLLLIAPAIDPNDVGEAYVGYKWAEYLNIEFDLTVLTFTKKGHENIVNKLPGAEIISWKEGGFFYKFERFNSMFKPWYFIFFFKSRKWIKSKINENNRQIDLALQLTPMAMRYPSPVCGLGIPFVIGPVGGGLLNLLSFEKELKKVPWYTKFRKLDGFRISYDPLLKESYLNAEMIIGTAPHVRELIHHNIAEKRVEIINENGVEKIFRINRSAKGKVKLLYVGRVIRTKGVRDLIRAIGLLKDDINIQVDIVGDGEDLQACRDEAKALEILEIVVFHGKLKRENVDVFYEQADLFVFPSFREPSGGVVIEAMSYGLPQIVANYGGPASIVTSETGLKVNPIDVESYPVEIAEAIKKLVLDVELRQKMSVAYYEHIATISVEE